MQVAGRTYITLEELKKELDLLSQFKINVFHWHLTENQAWRLESKIYPELNAPENMTRMPGKFYTLQEAKELVDFCKKRHVMLIPEIDMPGHSEAFNRTFQTDMQSEEGMTILKKLIDEVCATFGLSTTNDASLEKGAEAAQTDKKTSGSSINVVLLEKIGTSFTKKVAISDLLNFITP